MNTSKLLLLFVMMGYLNVLFALPQAPKARSHPGSTFYLYDYEYKKIELLEREIDLYLPVDQDDSKKFPVIVYGHGQALGSSHYEKSFIHFAKKGVAVIFPKYDKGFFDQQWERMADDFNELTRETLKNYKSLDEKRVVYSGHSKGAYVSLMAAGADSFNGLAKSLVLFSPAGFEKQYLERMNIDMPLTLIWGESDRIIDKDLVVDIFNKSPALYKQFIEVKDYPTLSASHFFMVSKKTVFGGTRGLSAYHYHGEHKWLLGAALDTLTTNRLSDPYVYGDLAQTSGDESVVHIVTRSWE